MARGRGDVFLSEAYLICGRNLGYVVCRCSNCCVCAFVLHDIAILLLQRNLGRLKLTKIPHLWPCQSISVLIYSVRIFGFINIFCICMIIQ